MTWPIVVVGWVEVAVEELDLRDVAVLRRAVDLPLAVVGFRVAVVLRRVVRFAVPAALPAVGLLAAARGAGAEAVPASRAASEAVPVSGAGVETASAAPGSVPFVSEELLLAVAIEF